MPPAGVIRKLGGADFLQQPRAIRTFLVMRFERELEQSQGGWQSPACRCGRDKLEVGELESQPGWGSVTEPRQEWTGLSLCSSLGAEGTAQGREMLQSQEQRCAFISFANKF